MTQDQKDTIVCAVVAALAIAALAVAHQPGGDGFGESQTDIAKTYAVDSSDS